MTPRPQSSARVIYWYDRQWRSWVVSVTDAYGNQVGDSTFVYTEGEARNVAKVLAVGALPGTPVLPIEKVRGS